MSIVNDIADQIKNVLSFTSDVGNALDKNSSKSFARGAQEQTFFFPAMIPNSCPINMAATCVRHLDRMYASFVQIYLSANGIIDLNYVKNPRQFINQYQSQIKLESSDDSDEELEELMEGYKDALYAGDSLFSDDNGKVMMLYTEGNITRGLTKKFIDGKQTVYDLYNTGNLPVYCEDSSDMKRTILDSYLDAKDKELNKDVLDVTSKLNSPRLVGEKEVKKLNDMQPYVLELNLLATKGDSSLAKYITYNIGVKTTLHLGKSDVLIQNIVYVLKNKNPMFNFLRWTTGEISLLKDIVLNLKDINFNVVNKYDSTGKFITTLKRMKKKPIKINRAGLSRTAPLATIVITSYEYSTILNEYGFDLKNITFARKVMDELYLMAFVIMDEATQTIDILLDGSTTGFQTYSLDMLERETTMNSSKLGKELTRMLGGN